MSLMPFRGTCFHCGHDHDEILFHTQTPKLEWIACSERKPSHGQNCLVWLCWDDDVNYVDTATWEESATGDGGWDAFSEDEVSHWIPMNALPEPNK